jgi:putative NIF3 family GTP cyclohydrolase 1 type 2
VNTSFGAVARALDSGAGLLVVHHASWSYIDLSLHERKLAALRDGDLALYVAHAPLDGAEDGTGMALARMLDVAVDGRFVPHEGSLAGVHGRVVVGWATFIDAVAERLGRRPRSIATTSAATESASSPAPGA